MQLDINTIIEVYAKKLSDAEKENVLLRFARQIVPAKRW